MQADEPDGGARKMLAPRYTAALSLLVLTTLGIMVWGNRNANIASLGLAWIVIVASSCLFVTKYLERKTNGPARDERPGNDGYAFEEEADGLGDDLPNGYFLIHGFPAVKGKIDRILICPKGIFTLEMDDRSGEVTFNGGKLLRNGRPFERDVLKQAWYQCFLVRDLLIGFGITSPLPEPVILFRNASVRIPGKIRGVEITGTGSLRQFLEPLPNRLSTTEAGKIFSRIRAATLL